MSEERRTLLIVLAVLVGAVVAVILWWHHRTTLMPHLVGVAVVTRAPGETVATDRVRLVPPGSKVEAAAVVTFRRGAQPLERLCAFDEVEVGGQRLSVSPPSAWPVSGGFLRAHWFTVEPSIFGAMDVTAAQAEGTLAYKDFLAPEMGRALRSPVTLEAHNDDFLATPLAGNLLGAGPIRLKVWVGAYPQETDIIARESVSSPGAEDIFNGTVAGVVVGIPVPAGVDPGVARFLRLGCFTFLSTVWPDGGPDWPLPLPPAAMVRRGLLVTPRTLAAGALGDVLGNPWIADIEVVARGPDWAAAGSSSPLRWETDVSAGDSLRVGERYIVLLEDDGDGVLSLGDRVMFAWEQPARIGPLAAAIPADAVKAVLLRAR
jgi:hypothetical protein